MAKRKMIIIFSAVTVIAVLVFINPGQVFTFLFIRALGHYKTPQVESSESIKNYVSGHGLYYDRLYVVNNSDNLIGLNKLGVTGVPTIQIFDHNQRLLTMADEGKCDWALSEFFKEQSNQMVATDSTTFPDVMRYLQPIELRSESDTFDYYIITYWAKYIPRLTHRLFAQTNSMKESMKENVCFMSVSLDQQPGWDKAGSGH